MTFLSYMSDLQSKHREPFNFLHKFYKLRKKSSDIKEWRFDGSMPSFSNSNKIRYVSSLYSKCTCESHSAYD